MELNELRPNTHEKNNNSRNGKKASDAIILIINYILCHFPCRLN